MAPPVALEELAGVVDFLLSEEIAELRVSALDLRPPRPTVIGEEKRSAEIERRVDQGPEGVCGALDAGFRVLRVEIENDASVVPACPSEETFGVAPDEPNGAVDDRRAGKPQEIGGRFS